ncbi:winged helix-turn-helix transcriptional regulator [Candidatus Lokiarchaeum ossiferum]|uniref:winged helix-turn-helix transcriptional regulator n=1 Tax=Candidatus Lokiarchaeum ossiferum TaxID=2951803 RepID=UPI00352CAB4A
MQKKDQKWSIFKQRKITFVLIFLFCITAGLLYYFFYWTLDRYVIRVLRSFLFALPFLIVISVVNGKELEIFCQTTILPKFAGDKVDVFENVLRRQIYVTIVEHNGIRFNNLRKTCNCSPGQLQWHLRKLLKYKLVKILVQDEKKLYFPSQNQIFSIQTQKKLLFSPIQEQIIKVLTDDSDLCIKMIAQRISKHKNTTRYHVLKLIDKGIIRAEIVGKKKNLKLNREFFEANYYTFS